MIFVQIHRTEELRPIQEVPVDENTVTILGDVNDQLDGRVVYVTYQANSDDNDGTSTFHIINEVSVATNCFVHALFH